MWRDRCAAAHDELNIVIAMLLKNLRDEIDATLARDPAARSRLEVVLCYPGLPRAAVPPPGALAVAARLAARSAASCRISADADRHRDPSRGTDRQAPVHRPRHGRGDRRDRRDRRRLHALSGRDARRHLADPRRKSGTRRSATASSSASHAQVLGPFRVGDGARIGASAVVLSEVPAGATMVGIPAQAGRPPRRIERGAAGVSALRRLRPRSPTRSPEPSTACSTRLPACGRAWPSSRRPGVVHGGSPTIDLPEPQRGNGAGEKERVS